MMGWGGIVDLSAGIFKKWFSKEANQEQRANKIELLEKEQLELSKINKDGKYNRHLVAISDKLAILYRQAKNTR